MCARAALAKSLVLLGAVVLAGACTERSSNLALTAPSFAASASSLPHINNTALPIPVAIAATSQRTIAATIRARGSRSRGAPCSAAMASR
jgi:hypothetical protein